MISLDNSNKYTRVDQFMANVIKQAYIGKHKRLKKMNFENLNLKYNKRSSSNLWAQYENKNNIVLGIHGADNLKLNLLGIKLLIDMYIDSKILNRICKKIIKISKNKKNVIIAGHSLGGFAINICLKNGHKLTKNLISFGSYTPKIDNSFSNNQVRKHLFMNDIFAKKLLLGDKLNNMFVYKNERLINSHSLSNFLRYNMMNNSLIFYQ